MAAGRGGTIQTTASGDEGAILANLYKKVLVDHELSYDRFLDLFRDRLAAMDDDTLSLSVIRDGLDKELLASSMTWKTFLRGMVLLRTEDLELMVTMTHINGSVTSHRLTFKPYQTRREEALVGELLAELLHRILYDLDISASKFQDLLVGYIRRHYKDKSRSELAGIKNALTKEFLAKNLTWKVFVKNLVFLQAQKVVFKLSPTYASGRKSEHFFTVLLSEESVT